jgi:hypothetical protein
MLASRFLSKRFPAVGTSMSDFDVDIELRRAHETVPNQPLGFVLGVDLSADRQKQLLDLGILPVLLDNHDDIATFLLRVCRRATTFSNKPK